MKGGVDDKTLKAALAMSAAEDEQRLLDEAIAASLNDFGGLIFNDYSVLLSCLICKYQVVVVVVVVVGLGRHP